MSRSASIACDTRVVAVTRLSEQFTRVTLARPELAEIGTDFLLHGAERPAWAWVMPARPCDERDQSSAIDSENLVWSHTAGAASTAVLRVTRRGATSAMQARSESVG